MTDQLNPGDYDHIPCPGPGPAHILVVPKFPRFPFAPLFCERCRGMIRITAELRARAVKG